MAKTKVVAEYAPFAAQRSNRCYKCARLEADHKADRYGRPYDHYYIPEMYAPGVDQDIPAGRKAEWQGVLHYGLNGKFSACGSSDGPTVSFYFLTTCKTCRIAARARTKSLKQHYLRKATAFGELPSPLCWPPELVMDPHYYFEYAGSITLVDCERCTERYAREQRRLGKIAKREAKERIRLAKQRAKRLPEERTPRSRRTPIREKRAQQRAGMGRALRPKDRRSPKPRSVRSGS